MKELLSRGRGNISSSIKKGSSDQFKNSSPSEHRESQDEAPFELTTIQSLLGATALVSGVLFYLSWLYHRRYFEAFFIRSDQIVLSAHDYILGAKSVLALGSFVILLLAIARFHINFSDKKVRLSISNFGLVIALTVIVYLVVDIVNVWTQRGPGNPVYRSRWMVLLAFLTLAIYSILAPTTIYNRTVISVKYKGIAPLVSWSGMLASVILLMSLAANYIGRYEGIYDTTVNSRLPLINIATHDPIGLDIQPDAILFDSNYKKVYVYYNLRHLVTSNDNLYVLRLKAGQGYAPPPTYVIPMSKAYFITFGPRTGSILTTTVTPSNQQSPIYP